jgi:hypothetical protein
MNRSVGRAVAIVAACALVVLTALFMAFTTWFALVWGFNPLMLTPLYMFALMICGVTIFLTVILRRR